VIGFQSQRLSIALGGFAEFSQSVQRVRQVPTRFVVTRVQAQRFAILDDGFAGAILHLKHDREIAMSVGPVRRAAKALTKTVLGLREFCFFRFQNSEIVERPGIVRIKTHRRLVSPDRVVGSFAGLKDDAEVVVREKLVGCGPAPRSESAPR
jgi:hypothetical protein